MRSLTPWVSRLSLAPPRDVLGRTLHKYCSVISVTDLRFESYREMIPLGISGSHGDPGILKARDSLRRDSPTYRREFMTYEPIQPHVELDPAISG